MILLGIREKKSENGILTHTRTTNKGNLCFSQLELHIIRTSLSESQHDHALSGWVRKVHKPHRVLINH